VRVDLLQLPAHVERRLHRSFGVVDSLVRDTPDRHQPVADELVDHSIVAFDDLAHVTEVFVEEFEQRAWVFRLAERGEVSDV